MVLSTNTVEGNRQNCFQTIIKFYNINLTLNTFEEINNTNTNELLLFKSVTWCKGFPILMTMIGLNFCYIFSTRITYEHGLF